jgi:hypothetical protein
LIVAVENQDVRAPHRIVIKIAALKLNDMWIKHNTRNPGG